MSGLPPIATEQRTSPLVRFVPKAEVKRGLLEHRCLNRIYERCWSRSRTKVEAHTQLDRVVLAPEGIIEGR